MNIFIDKTSGTGNSNIVLTIGENTETSEQIAIKKIKYNNTYKSITLKQAAKNNIVITEIGYLISQRATSTSSEDDVSGTIYYKENRGSTATQFSNQTRPILYFNDIEYNISQEAIIGVIISSTMNYSSRFITVSIMPKVTINGVSKTITNYELIDSEQTDIPLNIFTNICGVRGLVNFSNGNKRSSFRVKITLQDGTTFNIKINIVCQHS